MSNGDRQLQEGEDKLRRLVQNLEKSIEQAIASSPQVEECLARIREEGYELSLVLQATLAFAPRGELDQEQVEEVAGMMGLPVNTVKTHLHRARAALASALGAKERP